MPRNIGLNCNGRGINSMNCTAISFYKHIQVVNDRKIKLQKLNEIIINTIL